MEIRELLEFGILNIDKPSGPTSFDISDYVRKKLKLRKTSHFGTLDPKVTGVLPIALNRACKLTGFFLGEDKEYVGVMRIHKDIEIEKIKKVINKKFIGKIKQIPPVKSRVKRVEREREIYSFELLEKDGKDILFKVKCEGGTYIRKLIDDLGKEIGIGAHMLELRRTRAGLFSENDKNFVNLYEFDRAVEELEKGNDYEIRKIIIPAEEIIKKRFKKIEIKKKEVDRLLTGKPIFEKDIEKKPVLSKGELICAFYKNKFIGIYEVLNEEIFAKPKFVLQPIKQQER